MIVFNLLKCVSGNTNALIQCKDINGNFKVVSDVIVRNVNKFDCGVWTKLFDFSFSDKGLMFIYTVPFESDSDLDSNVLRGIESLNLGLLDLLNRMPCIHKIQIIEEAGYLETIGRVNLRKYKRVVYSGGVSGIPKELLFRVVRNMYFNTKTRKLEVRIFGDVELFKSTGRWY